MIRYFHDCGGIHAAGPAWDEFGWECVGISEIEKFPIAVVQHHYPNLKQHGDTTKISLDGANLDLLIGGTPCQGFSVAGKRGGLSDVRSNLAWNFLRLAAESRARWIIWENVPGASSTNEGQDLLAFTQEVGKLGYGFAWRTLDAQYFGVPQRRRRIFLVGHLGDWRPAAAVLFESESLRGNFAPRRKTRQGVATHARSRPESLSHWEGGPHPTLSQSMQQGGIGYSNQEIFSQHGAGLVSRTLLGKENCSHDPSLETYVFENHAQDSRIKQVELCPQLNAKDGTGGNNLPLVMQQPLVSFDCVGTQVQTSTNEIAQTMRSMTHDKSHQNRSSHLAVCIAPTLTASNDPSRSPQSSEVTNQVEAVVKAIGTVRRLTPRECERLQGFPDDWCKIPWRGKPAELCPDGPQYKAYGNSIAVPVLRWLGKRIVTVQRII